MTDGWGSLYFWKRWYPSSWGESTPVFEREWEGAHAERGLIIGVHLSGGTKPTLLLDKVRQWFWLSRNAANSLLPLIYCSVCSSLLEMKKKNTSGIFCLSWPWVPRSLSYCGWGLPPQTAKYIGPALLVVCVVPAKGFSCPVYVALPWWKDLSNLVLSVSCFSGLKYSPPDLH